jgi:hypothetical protein
LQGTTGALFDNPQPTGATIISTGTNLTYGTPYDGPGGASSRIDFVGRTVALDPAVSTPVALGTLRLANGVIVADTGVTGVDLNLILATAGGTPQLRTLKLPLGIDNTLNEDVNPQQDADTVTLPSGDLPSLTFVGTDGVTYRLDVTGYGQATGGTVSGQTFTVLETQTGQVELQGRVVALGAPPSPPSTPLPQPQPHPEPQPLPTPTSPPQETPAPEPEPVSPAPPARVSHAHHRPLPRLLRILHRHPHRGHGRVRFRAWTAH